MYKCIPLKCVVVRCENGWQGRFDRLAAEKKGFVGSIHPKQFRLAVSLSWNVDG